MKFNMSSVIAGIKQNYDKIIVFVVFLVLLASVASLGHRVVREKQEIERSGKVQAVVTNAEVEPVDLDRVDAALDLLSEPFRIENQINRMMVAEIRVACVNCGKPIPIRAEKCPFCGTPQKEKPDDSRDLDSDGDLMPDWWENKYGLNPRDPEDAHKDMDGDGFTNVEEYLAGTDPADFQSYPPPISKLRLIEVRQRPVYYRFMSVSKIGEKLVFTIKDIRTNQDFYRKTGETVGEYTIVDFEERFATVNTSAGAVKRDASILKLERNGRITVLTMRSDKVEGELVARLVFQINDETYDVGVDSEIQLMDKVYKVVDITLDSVIVFDELTGDKIIIGKASKPTTVIKAAESDTTETDESGF